MEFKSKYGEWALITGATSGIGEAFANQIAEKGINIVLVARDKTNLTHKAQFLKEKYKVDSLIISADIGSEAGINEIKTKTESLNVGLVVLSAGLEVNGAFNKTDIQRELAVVNINVVATLQLTHHFIPMMIGRKKGGILMVASLSGHMPNPYFANYAGSKAYILNFGASLYGELKPKGIDIAVLSPGLTNTPMAKSTGVDWGKTPMKPLEPELVAKAGLKGLGKKLLIVPGVMNKIMAGMSKHSPIQMLAGMNRKMMAKAIKEDLL